MEFTYTSQAFCEWYVVGSHFSTRSRLFHEFDVDNTQLFTARAKEKKKWILDIFPSDIETMKSPCQISMNHCSECKWRNFGRFS